MAAARVELPKALSAALKRSGGGVIIKGTPGVGKTTALVDAAVARARAGKKTVVAVPTRLLAGAVWRELAAQLPSGAVSLLLGRADKGGGIGIHGDAVTSCVNQEALLRTPLGLRCPGICGRCEDREECLDRAGGMLRGLDQLDKGSALVTITTAAFLASLTGSEQGLPPWMGGVPLVLDDCAPGHGTVLHSSVRAARSCVQAVLARDPDLGPLARWLDALDTYLSGIAASLGPSVEYGPPLPLPPKLAAQAADHLATATGLHAEGKLPAAVLTLLARAGTAWVSACRNTATEMVQSTVSFPAAPQDWPGPVVALDATGRSYRYQEAWPGRKWEEVEIRVPCDPHRISTATRSSPRWTSGYLLRLHDHEQRSKKEIEARILTNAALELDSAELRARAVATARQRVGAPCAARVLVPRRFLLTAPSLADLLRIRIEGWGFSSVSVRHWRSTESRGVNSAAGCAFTFTLGAPRSPSSAHLAPPTVRAGKDWMEHARFWSSGRDGSPNAWTSPQDIDALVYMILDSADVFDQEVSRDRAEVSDSPAPVLRWCVMPPPIRITKEAPAAWSGDPAYPPVRYDEGQRPTVPNPTLGPLRERPVVLEGPHVVSLDSSSDRLASLLPIIEREGWAVATTARIRASLGCSDRQAERRLEALAAVGLGGLKLRQPGRGAPPLGVLVRLGTPDEALADVRKTHPDTTGLLPDSRRSPLPMIFRQVSLDLLSAGVGKTETFEHHHEGIDGVRRSWTEAPHVLEDREGCLAALEEVASKDEARKAWARARRKQVDACAEGDTVPLGRIYRSDDGRLRDTNIRATASKSRERAHYRAQPGYQLVDLDLIAAHPSAAFTWSGEGEDPRTAYARIQSELGIERGPAKKAMVVWINGAGAEKLTKITGVPDTKEKLEALFPKITALQEAIRRLWNESAPGQVLRISTRYAPGAWAFEVERPASWRTLASRMWTRPEALWLDKALPIISRSAITAAVAVPIYDGVLVQMPQSPWHPWRQAWLAHVLGIVARGIGLETDVKAKNLGRAWSGDVPWSS